MDTLRTEMRNEMAEMRGLLQNLAGSPKPAGVPASAAVAEDPPRKGDVTAPMQALLNFANNTPPEGHLSHTAARMSAESTPAPPTTTTPAGFALSAEPGPGAPQSPTPWPERPVGYSEVPATGGTPHAGAMRGVAQAREVKRMLIEKEAMRSVNPYWANAFWQELANYELAQGPFEPDLRRMIVAGGYAGPSTVGAPRVALRSQLDWIIPTGLHPHGSGAQLALEPGWLARATADPGATRWEDQLPPDLPRAAPEIYRSARTAGAANIRDWLHRHYQGPKNDSNTEWKTSWNAATEVDYAIARCANMDEVNHLLVSSDPIEIKMRTLASQEYLARTGDRCGANQMLAVKPPGVGVDLAPAWPVKEVTQYSKAEHQRRERVASANRGRGRGRGQNQAGAPAPQQEQQGEAGERARGGRRGGRRGAK